VNTRRPGRIMTHIYYAFGHGKAHVRMLKEAERVPEEQALAELLLLSPEDIAAWESQLDRWIVELRETREDVEDVVNADDSVIAAMHVDHACAGCDVPEVWEPQYHEDVWGESEVEAAE
jgi:hypothetical protein